MLPLPGLSPVGAKKVIAQFDGGLLSSDAGVLVLREVEQRLRVAERMAACIVDPRAPEQITHTLADIICFRLLMIAGGYEDGNDANSLRVDPVFKMAHDLSPSDRDLCSQSTISRLENLPDARALLRMGRAMIDLYCESFTQVPKRITLDIDDMFDAVHGGQQLRLFNAHYDEYGFQPIVVFDGAGRFVTAVLRPARRPGGKEIRALLRRLLRTIRSHWPKTEILLRGDSHYCTPETIDFCRANGLDFIFGVAPTSTLRAHILALEAKATAMFEAAPKNGIHQTSKESTAINSPFHTPVKVEVKGSNSISELSHQNIGLCDDHIECKPVSKTTVRMYAAMACKAVCDAGITICAEKPGLVFPWAAGLDIIDPYADNLGEWDDCCICTVTDILLGPGALPLMVGLLVIGKYSVYQKCLNGMRLDLAEEEVKESDKLFRELAGIHLKYMKQDDI